MLGSFAFPFLITVAVGGVAYVFIYPLLSGEKRVEQRMKDISSEQVETRRARRTVDPAASRRQAVEETLKQMEERRKNAKRPPLGIRLQRAGLDWSKRQFWMASAGFGLVVLLASWFMGAELYVAAIFAVAAGFALPRWVLSFLKKRRENKFLEELPNAVDVIVRGVKAGLPIGDCIRIIANETQEPVKSEFRAIAESTAMGIPLSDAAAKLFDRIPLPESNFFGIVVAIQQKAGGSLSEALGNLSRVLRERKKMKAKIQAMSMEAKASAGIIGSLPIAVMILVYLTSPNYIELLWTTPMGHLMLFGSGVWMTIGILVMRKMINFDF
ncbi:MAG TPA: type II secretion system F family protein [Xanthobacteraceae bacterium]|nr:type II secretion system F family protein [Xanthobacteraceae bacterium]